MRKTQSKQAIKREKKERNRDLSSTLESLEPIPVLPLSFFEKPISSSLATSQHDYYFPPSINKPSHHASYLESESMSSEEVQSDQMSAQQSYDEDQSMDDESMDSQIIDPLEKDGLSMLPRQQSEIIQEVIFPEKDDTSWWEEEESDLEGSQNENQSDESEIFQSSDNFESVFDLQPSKKKSPSMRSQNLQQIVANPYLEMNHKEKRKYFRKINQDYCQNIQQSSGKKQLASEEETKTQIKGVKFNDQLQVKEFMKGDAPKMIRECPQKMYQMIKKIWEYE